MVVGFVILKEVWHDKWLQILEVLNSSTTEMGLFGVGYMNTYIYHIYKETKKEDHIHDKNTLNENNVLMSNTTDVVYISTQYFAQHHRRQFHIYIQYTSLPLLHAIKITSITFSTTHCSTSHTTTSISIFSIFCSVHICYCIKLVVCCNIHNKFITQ